MNVAWFCACGMCFEGFVHDRVRPRLEGAWKHVHSGRSHRAITRGEWEVAQAHAEAIWQDLLRDYGLTQSVCNVLIPLLVPVRIRSLEVLGG